MKVAVPVTCHNGHEAKWYIEINGIEVRHLGVPNDEKCDCPKWNVG